MEALSYGISIFIGLVAGVIVSLMADYIRKKREYRQEVRNLSFELGCNLKKINRWIDEVRDLKNKISDDRLLEFYGYFNFSLTIYSTFVRMINEGSLYQCLSQENIERLQEVGNYLTINGENLINGQVRNYKENINNGIYNKQEAARTAEFWERTLCSCKDSLEKVIMELDK